MGRGCHLNEEIDMGNYLPPGSCDAEIKGLKDSKSELEKAWRNYQSAVHNMQAGGVAAGAGGIGAIGCILAGTGIGAIVCMAAAGATMISGELWTESAGESLINAGDDLDNAINKADDAIKTACKCYDSHMLSVPDD
jgi:hypothetical protein